MEGCVYKGEEAWSSGRNSSAGRDLSGGEVLVLRLVPRRMEGWLGGTRAWHTTYIRSSGRRGPGAALLASPPRCQVLSMQSPLYWICLGLVIASPRFLHSAESGERGENGAQIRKVQHIFAEQWEISLHVTVVSWFYVETGTSLECRSFETGAGNILWVGFLLVSIQKTLWVGFMSLWTPKKPWHSSDTFYSSA